MIELIGKVVHGKGVGKKLGFPTVNIHVDLSRLDLKKGVYAAEINLENKKYKAAAVVFEKNKSVELFIFEYKGSDIYGEKVVVEVFQKVSDVKRCESEEELKKKIESDIKLIKRIFR
ncbi:MAG: riboflavin kinase [Candidatus Magasanikbacteria bacterium]